MLDDPADGFAWFRLLPNRIDEIPRFRV